MEYARSQTARLYSWLFRNTQCSERTADLDRHVSDLTPFYPAIQDLQAVIEGSAELFVFVNQMLAQVLARSPFTKDAHGMPQVRDLHTKLRSFNTAITSAPEYTAPHLMMISLPFSSIVNWFWLIGTQSGSAFFLNKEVNAQLQSILEEWTRYLILEASTYALNDSPKGWFCTTAMDTMLGASGNIPKPRFEDQYVCDASKPHYRFKSWDAFFTRKLREEVRTVASLEDDGVIINACESTPYRLALNVQKYDSF